MELQGRVSTDWEGTRTAVQGSAFCPACGFTGKFVHASVVLGFVHFAVWFLAHFIVFPDQFV